LVRFLNEIGQHFFGDLEVRDDPVFHRLDGDDVSRRDAPSISFCFAAHSHDFSLDCDGHDRGFVEDNAFAVPRTPAYWPVPRSMARSEENRLNTDLML